MGFGQMGRDGDAVGWDGIGWRGMAWDGDMIGIRLSGGGVQVGVGSVWPHRDTWTVCLIREILLINPRPCRIPDGRKLYAVGAPRRVEVDHDEVVRPDVGLELIGGVALIRLVHLRCLRRGGAPVLVSSRAGTVAAGLVAQRARLTAARWCPKALSASAGGSADPPCAAAGCAWGKPELAESKLCGVALTEPPTIAPTTPSSMWYLNTFRVMLSVRVPSISCTSTEATLHGM